MFIYLSESGNDWFLTNNWDDHGFDQVHRDHNDLAPNGLLSTHVQNSISATISAANLHVPGAKSDQPHLEGLGCGTLRTKKLKSVGQRNNGDACLTFRLTHSVGFWGNCSLYI